MGYGVSMNIEVGSEWMENCKSPHIVTVTEIDDEFATGTMVRIESDCCNVGLPLDDFLNRYIPVKKSEPVEQSDSWTEPATRGIRPIYRQVPFEIELGLVYSSQALEAEIVKQDMVNNPPHYTSDPSGIECIEIAEHMPFCLGNCYKYLHRAGLKGDMRQDLAKALWYAKRAFLNGEKIPNDYVRNRIFEVSQYRSNDLRPIFVAFAQFGENGNFYNRLSKLLGELENAPTKQ